MFSSLIKPVTGSAGDDAVGGAVGRSRGTTLVLIDIAILHKKDCYQPQPLKASGVYGDSFTFASLVRRQEVFFVAEQYCKKTEITTGYHDKEQNLRCLSGEAKVGRRSGKGQAKRIFYFFLSNSRLAFDWYVVCARFSPGLQKSLPRAASVICG